MQEQNQQENFDILTLIDMIKAYPILYSKNIKSTKDSRELAWNTISEQINLPLHVIKTKWRSLKDSIGRLRRDRSRIGKKSWYMLNYLDFLPSVKELIKERDSFLYQNVEYLITDMNEVKDSEAAANSVDPIAATEITLKEDTFDKDSATLDVQQDPLDDVGPSPAKIIKPSQSTIKVVNPPSQLKPIAPKPSSATSTEQTTFQYVKLTQLPQPAGSARIYQIVNSGASSGIVSSSTSSSMASMAVDQSVDVLQSPGAARVTVAGPSTNTIASATVKIKPKKVATESPINTSTISNKCDHLQLATGIYDKFAEDEVGYGMHIANQLRNLPTYEREILRNKIDNLIFETKMSLEGRLEKSEI